MDTKGSRCELQDRMDYLWTLKEAGVSYKTEWTILWTLKDAVVSYKTEWTILDKAKPCCQAAKKCDLCLEEKYFILLDKSSSLDKRTTFSEPAPTLINTRNNYRDLAVKLALPRITCSPIT